jgi:hypothetical protein
MFDKPTLKGLAKFIWSIEDKFNLLDFEINGVKIWQYQRQRIFLDIAKQLGLFEKAHTKKIKFANLLVAAPSLLYYSIFSNPIIGNYQKETLVFSSGRKIKEENKFIDIYTEYFVRQLKKESFEIIEELYLNKHFTSDRKNRKHQDFQQIRTFLKSKLSSFALNELEEEYISKIEIEIFNFLGIKLNLKKQMRNGYLFFKNDFEFYENLINKRKPKQIFMVCSYDYKMALVAAAKKNNVEAIEIQHGTMNEFHLGYSYPNHDYIDYFPDKIYFWGEYWKNCTHFPIKEENKIIYGFPFFQKQKEKFKETTKQKGRVLIISQGTIGNKLSEFIWNNRDLFEELTISYKLHPGEYDRWKTDYPYLQKINMLENFTIVDNNNTNLYSYMAKSEFVIGVYSTAIYEALSFKCKGIVINLPGVEYFNDLIKDKIVRLVNNKEELHSCFKFDNYKKFNANYFFS